MDIIKCSIIYEFLENHPDAESALSLWYKCTYCGCWENFEQMSQTFPKLRKAGKFVAFSIGNGSYFIVASVDYKHQRLFIRNISKRADYDQQQT